MKRIGSAFIKVARLSRLDWLYLAVAVKELLIARLHYAFRPTGPMLRDLQTRSQRRTEGNAQFVDLSRVAWSIGVASAWVPWRSDCLPQAMAAARWLNRAGITPQVFVGVKKSDDGLLAHAWVKCGDELLTGGSVDGFVPLLEPKSRLERAEWLTSSTE